MWHLSGCAVRPDANGVLTVRTCQARSFGAAATLRGLSTCGWGACGKLTAATLAPASAWRSRRMNPGIAGMWSGRDMTTEPSEVRVQAAAGASAAPAMARIAIRLSIIVASSGRPQCRSLGPGGFSAATISATLMESPWPIDGRFGADCGGSCLVDDLAYIDVFRPEARLAIVQVELPQLAEALVEAERHELFP